MQVLGSSLIGQTCIGGTLLEFKRDVPFLASYTVVDAGGFSQSGYETIVSATHNKTSLSNQTNALNL